MNITYKDNIIILHDEMLSGRQYKRFKTFMDNRLQFMHAKDAVDLWNKFAKKPEHFIILETKKK